MSLEKKYAKEIKQILAKYPPEHKRSAVMPLLHLVQKDEGFTAFARDFRGLSRPALRVRHVRHCGLRIRKLSTPPASSPVSTRVQPVASQK